MNKYEITLNKIRDDLERMALFDEPSTKHEHFQDIKELVDKETPFTPTGDPREKGLCKCGIDLYERSYKDNYCYNCGQRIDWSS